MRQALLARQLRERPRLDRRPANGHLALILPLAEGRSAMMRLTTTTLVVLGLLVAAKPAFSAPPAEAKPLSEIVKMLEDGGNAAYITEIEWDERGYWEVDYIRTGGAKIEVKLDPVSGEPKPSGVLARGPAVARRPVQAALAASGKRARRSVTRKHRCRK